MTSTPIKPEFRASTESRSSLTEAFLAVSKIAKEAAITATPEGLSLRAMDPSRCAMVELEIPADYFYVEVEKPKPKPKPKKSKKSSKKDVCIGQDQEGEKEDEEEEDGANRYSYGNCITEKVTKYECPSPVVIGLSIERLLAVLRRFNSWSSILTIEKRDSVLIISEKPKRGHYDSDADLLERDSKSFEMNLLDLEPETFEASKLPWAVKFNAGSSVNIKEAIQDAKAVGADALVISATRSLETKEQPHPHHTITARAQGQYGKSESQFRDNCAEFSGSAQEAKAPYDLAFLDRMLVGSGQELRFATAMPLHAVQHIGYDDKRRIMIRHYLAPRLDEEGNGVAAGSVNAAEAKPEPATAKGGILT